METVFVMATLFIAFPIVLFHFITKWRSAATITTEDENLLDELHDLARRLDDRMVTIERIIQAENPGWRSVGQDPVEAVLEDRTSRGLRSDRVTELGRGNRPAGRNR